MKTLPMSPRKLVFTVFLIVYAVLAVWAAGRLAIASNLGDTWRGAMLADMVSGEAERPYVYRVLMPWVVGLVDAATPVALKAFATEQLAVATDNDVLRYFAQERPFLQQTLANGETLYIRFIAMLAMLGCMAGYAAALYKLSRRLAPDEWALALFTPVIGFLFVPALANKVAYIYDASALALSAACCYAMAAQKWRWYYAWFLLACLNKESACLMGVLFALWFWPRMDKKTFLTHLAAQAGIFIIIKFALSLYFADNPGIFLKTDYLQSHIIFLLVGYDYQSLAVLCAAAFLLLHGWRSKPEFARLGLPLFGLMYAAYFMFGKPEEYRVFYDIVPLLAVLVTHSLISATGVAQLSLFNTAQHESR